MDTVVVVAISILGVIFVGALAFVLVLCRHRYCKPIDLLTKLHSEHTSPDAVLVEDMETVPGVEQPSDVELNDVGRHIDQVLRDQSWVNDASGLVPHCLAILKTTHQLTERLVAMTMGNGQQLKSPEKITELVSTAKRIGPRVDEVVKAMYPPLDPRLLEARSAALLLSVSHLVLITKNACHMSGELDWIDQSQADAEEHLRVLHQASLQYESHNQQTTCGPRPPLNHDTALPTAQPTVPQTAPQPDLVHDNIPRNEISSQV